MNAFRLFRTPVLASLASVAALAVDSTFVTEPPPPQFPTHGSIERLAPELDALIAPGTEMERLADGFVWSEGPTWSIRENAVLFSDVPVNKIYRWSDKDGLSVYLDPSGYSGVELKFNEQGSNGLTTDKKNNLIICQHGNRQIARLLSRKGVQGKFETVVGNIGHRRFNSPNDLCYARDERLYFTDPPYGLEGLNKSPAKEIMVNGVYLRRPNGEVELLTGALSFPNGIALSPDEKTLYVNVSDPARPVLMAYDVNAKGTIANGRVFFDTQPLASLGRKGLPDGLKVDQSGNVWATGPGGVLVITPSGKHLGTLLTGEATGNCGWGDDGSTLYITADMYLLRIKTLTHGHSPWGKP
ncbi:MAG TPA: SMP-30/gluconolactonase/LRE family protein [Verrucomicrobiota bacterium]|nr:gluconolactonase [Verrucomicrobiales bacterium]HRI13702.1 SMP-30/gluconolactonase/LRE family protein [Verrucomicrobiota bacterium]